MSKWLVYVTDSGSTYPAGAVEANDSSYALTKAYAIFGGKVSRKQSLVVVVGNLPPARPTVWSRLRHWEV